VLALLTSITAVQRLVGVRSAEQSG
jgi:hypothetical protein